MRKAMEVGLLSSSKAKRVLGLEGLEESVACL